MGLNRIIKKNSASKNIKATITIAKLTEEYSTKEYGYDVDRGGIIVPNPLPNDIEITYLYGRYYKNEHSSVVSIRSNINGEVTINNMRISLPSGSMFDVDGNVRKVFNYLKENIGNAIPIIFHFKQ